MSFAKLPTEIRLQILLEYLSTYAVPPRLLTSPPGYTATHVIYPRQPPFTYHLKKEGNVSIRIPPDIRAWQRFWGGAQMASLFTVNRQFALDLSELINRQASFLLPLSHARCLGRLPDWVRNMESGIANSIRHLDLMFEIRRYDAEEDPRAALLAECRTARSRFPGLDTLILRTFVLFGSIEGLMDEYWQPSYRTYLDDLGVALEVFSGVRTIRLWVLEEHSSSRQGVRTNWYRGNATWMIFERDDEERYRMNRVDDLADQKEQVSSLSELWHPAWVRERHSWVYPIPKYPMTKKVNGIWVWNLGMETEHPIKRRPFRTSTRPSTCGDVLDEQAQAVFMDREHREHDEGEQKNYDDVEVHDIKASKVGSINLWHKPPHFLDMAAMKISSHPLQGGLSSSITLLRPVFSICYPRSLRIIDSSEVHIILSFCYPYSQLASTTKMSADIPTTSYPELSGDEADIEAYSHDGDTSDHSRSPVDSSSALPPRIVPTVEIEDATVLRTDQSKKGDSAFPQPLSISKASVLEPGAISYTSDWTFVSSSSRSWRPPKWDEIMYAKNLHSVATAPRSFLGGADIWTQKVRKDDEDTKLENYRRLKEFGNPSKLPSPVPFKSTKALTPAPDHREVRAGASGSSGTQYRYDPFQHDNSPTTPSDAKTPPDYPVSPITPSPDSSLHNQNQYTYLTWQLLSPSQNLQPREATSSEYHSINEPTVLEFSPAAQFKKQLLIIGYEQTWLTNPTLQNFINHMQHLHDQGSIELTGAVDEDTAMQHLTPAPHPNSSRSPLLPSAIFVTDPGVFRRGFDVPVALRNYVVAGGHLVFGGPFAALLAEHELDVFSRAFFQTWTLEPVAYGLIWAHAPRFRANFRANFRIAPEACGLDGPPRWAAYRGVRDVQPGEVYETTAADFPSRAEAPYDPRSPPVLYERLGALYDSMVDSPPVVYERMGHGSLAYIGIIEDDMFDPEFALELLLLHLLEYEPDRLGEGDGEDQADPETQEEAAEGEGAAEEQEDVEEASTIAADDGDIAVEERRHSVDTVLSASSMEMIEGKRRRKSRVTTEVDERDAKGVKINEADESVTEGEKIDDAEGKTEKIDEADESKTEGEKTEGEKTEDSDEEETQGPKIDKGKGKLVYDDWIVEHFMME